MWGHMARIVGEVRPRYVFVENSPALLTRGLGRVLGDLAALGYDCRWTVLGAADVGAPHQRDRFWLVGADSDRVRLDRQGQSDCAPEAWDDAGWGGETVAHAECKGLQGGAGGWLPSQGRASIESAISGADVSHAEHGWSGWRKQFQARRGEAWGNDAWWWQSEPDVGRVAHGVAARVDRLKAIGNGQVPLCAVTAWRLLA
jgi:DNA (cytosine-5)-methyltransferase 1